LPNIDRLSRKKPLLRDKFFPGRHEIAVRTHRLSANLKNLDKSDIIGCPPTPKLEIWVKSGTFFRFSLLKKRRVASKSFIVLRGGQAPG
jgi:hypothetical protein